MNEFVDVEGYLRSKGLVLKRASANEVNTLCFFHGEEQGKRGRLYINIDPGATIPGLFMCHRCDARGSLVSIKKHFGDATEAADDTSDTRREILQAAAGWYHEQLSQNEDAYDWLREKRGLTFETIVDHELGWAPGGLYKWLRGAGYKAEDIINTGLCFEDPRVGRIVDALQNMVTIPYHVAGNVVMIRGRTFPYKGDGYPEEHTGPKYKTPANQSSRLFNTDAAWGAEEIVITEGEFDALVAKQLGLAAVGSPGANTWQDTWDGYLEDARRVFVVFDQDQAGQQGVEKLLGRFGAKIKPVELPLEDGQTKTDLTAWAQLGHGAEEFRALLDNAGTAGLIVTVDDAFAEHQEVQGKPGLKFGIEALDSMISPGLIAGQVMVVLAKSGTGKTIFVLNAMQRMLMVPGQENLDFLFVSLEQTRGDWWERARRIHRFYNVDSTEQDALEFWRPRLLLTDKNRLAVDEFKAVLDDYEYRRGKPPDCVFIDYLGYWAQSFKGERYERVSDAIMALKGVTKDRMLRVITPHQVSRGSKYGEEPDADSARDAGVIEETADFVMTLWTQDHILGKAEDEKSGVVNMRIGKSRHGGRGTKIQFQFAPLCLAMVPHGQGLSEARFIEQARNELHYEQIRDPWTTAVERHIGLHGAEGALARPLVKPEPIYTYTTPPKGL